MDLVVKNAYPLRGKHDQPLDIETGDSEGLAIVRGNNGIRDDEELLVNFERQPRISRYRPWACGWLMYICPTISRMSKVMIYQTDPSKV